LVLVLGAGCNQVLGLSSTQVIDAGFYDAQIDAPFACPPTGTGMPPRFSRLLHQVVVQPVFEYTTSSATMRAVAQSPSGVVEGPIDDVMTPATGLGGSPACLACAQLVFPRLTPEGDGVYGVLSSMFGAHLALYRRAANEWMEVQAFGTPLGSFLSSVTRGPTRHLMIYDGVAFHEYAVDDGGGSTEVLPAYQPGDLGLFNLGNPMFTADGLRMVFPGTVVRDGTTTTEMYYADRPDLAARFTTATALVDVPVVDSAYLTEDCSRIYISGLGSLFYAQRL